MSPFEKIQEGFFEHIGTAVAVALVGLVARVFLEVAPVVAPVLESLSAAEVLSQCWASHSF